MSSKSAQLTRASDEVCESETADTPALERDEIFHLLQTNRRRDTIRYLLRREEDGPVKMRDVAEHVAAREHDTTVEALSSDERQRVYIPLYQSHLPKLDEEGVIEYDQSRGVVRPTDQLETFRPYLQAAGDVEDDEDQLIDPDAATDYYVTATGASTSLLLASAFGLLAIPGLALGAIITLLFVFVTVATASPNSFTLADAAN